MHKHAFTPAWFPVDEFAYLSMREEPSSDLTTRSCPVRAESAQDGDRSVEAVFATEDPVMVRDPDTWQVIDEVLRMDGCEIPDEMSLLNNHFRYSLDDVLGSARGMRIESVVLRGRIFFASDDDVAERAWKKVKQRHLRDVSIGYRVLTCVDIPAGQTREVSGKSYTAGPRTLRIATRWQPREVSLVPVGADPKAKIREAAATLQHSSPHPTSTLRNTTVPKQLRQYLESIGLRSDADEAAAVAFFRQLTGEQRTRADAQVGAWQPPVSSAPGAQTTSAPDGQRQASPPSPASSETPITLLPVTAPTPEQMRQQGVELERRRQARILELAGDDVSVELRQQAINEGWDETRAAPAFLDDVRGRRRPPAGNGGQVGIHSRGHDQDCNLAALQAAMMVRQGVSLDAPALTNDRARNSRLLPTWLRQDINAPDRQRAMEFGHRFASLSLVDQCREAVRIGGGRVTHDVDDMIRTAVSGGTLSAIFSTNINAELLIAYIEAPDTTNGWCAETDVANFLAHERSSMGKFGALSKQGRGQTAEHLDAGDSKESSKIARYTGQFVVDDQDIINDRFGAVEQLSPREMGNLAAALRPDLVYALLLANGALDADSVALFHSTHSNTDTNALSAPNIEAGIAKMSKQRIRGRAINVRPRFLITPHDIRFSANIYLTSAQRFDGSSTGTAGGNKNPLAEEGIVAVADDRIGAAGVTDPASGTAYTGSTTTWFLSARPGEGGAKTAVVKYRRGTGRAPQIRSFMLDKGQWGIGWDILHDIGADIDDYRGLYRGNT